MDNRLKKLKWNSISALSYQFLLIITGLILPRFFLYYYGSEVSGLISSITQFLAFINICDCGIGAVVSAAYYKPLADGDTYGVSKIFAYSRRFFGRVGFVLLAYIAVLFVAYPKLVNDTFDFWFTFGLIAAMGLSQLGQYFVGISYQLLLSSDQKSYIQLIVNGSALFVNTIASVVLIICGTSVQMVKLTTSLIYLVRPLMMHLYVKRNYVLDKHIPIEGSVIPQKRNGVVQHIAYVVYENTDVMVLTLFSTLENVSIYAVYTLVTSSIKQIITATTTGVQAMFGNMIARDETEQLKSFYLLYNWGIHTLCTVLYTITGLLIVPFVQIYTAGVTDANYNVPVFALLITVAYYFSSIRNCQYVLIRAAGHFKGTQTASLIECFLNLSVSMVLVSFIGLAGVAIGTIIATAYFVFYEIRYFSKNIVAVSVVYSVKQFVVDLLIVGTTSLLATKIQFFAGSVLSWVFQASAISLVCIAISSLGQIVFYRSNIAIVANKIFSKS